MEKKHSRKDFMKMAIEEHSKCIEFPRVGVVIARDDELLSTGYRGERTGIHAERVAIEKLELKQLVNSTLYTTLEPCVDLFCDQKIESCTDLITKSGITEVVIGVLDPNGTIYSKGYEALLENKIHVEFFGPELRDVIEGESFKVGNSA